MTVRRGRGTNRWARYQRGLIGLAPAARLARWVGGWPARRLGLAAVAGLLLLSAALLGHWSPLQAQEGEAAAPEATGASGVTIRLDDLVDLITYSFVDRFDVQLANLDAATTYEVVVSSSHAAALGIGGCGEATQRATVTGATSRHVEFRVYACGLGAGTVTAALRVAGASRAAVTVSQDVTVEPIPDWVPADERPVRGAAGAVAQVGTPGFVKNPRFEQVMTTSVVAKWDTPTADGGKKLSGYGLLFWHEDEEHPSYRDDVLVKGLTPREHTYTGLQHDATYKFRIHACNKTPACGWWTTPPLEVTTQRAPTPHRPHTIGFSQLTARSVVVTWSAAANTGGVPLTGFDIRYWPYDSENPDRETGATTHPADGGTDRGETLRGLAASTEYEVKMRACNGPKDRHCSSWSADHRFTTLAGTTPTPDRTVPTNLDVAPLAERRARVTWAPVSGARGYVVQVRPVGSTSEENWQASSGTHFHIGAGDSLRHGLDVHLDSFVTGGLAAHSGYQLRVLAITGRDSQGTDVLSEPSETIVIMDTPIRTVNGDVRDGAVDVNWRPVASILGDGYAGGSYRFRSRLLGGDHTSLSWRPGSDTAGYGIPQDTGLVPAGTTSHPIRDLLHERIYAIQLRYEIELDTEVTEATTKVFAVRDAYVWPSKRAADGGERVASYPLNFGLINAGYEPTSTYEYRLCTDTFPELDPDLGGVGWSDFLSHGIDQWWIATNGLVRRVHNTTPCSTYRPVVERLTQVATKAIGSDGPETDAVIRSHIEGFVARTRYSSVLRNALLRMAKQTDPGDVVSEVFMFKRNAEPAIFDMASDVASPRICGNDGLGCAILRVEHESRGWIVDVALRKDGVFDPWYIRDDGTREAVFVPELPAIAFNRCFPSLSVNQRGRFAVVYSTLVHEVGHVFGIGWGKVGPDQTANHPNDELKDESALARGLLQICSPTPLDVLAVQAKYQTATR